ncbi:MAG: MMPL family transporter [Planctomycetes bacterium]|nr:MMPL family transporter [Planctomycetota bacterium]
MLRPLSRLVYRRRRWILLLSAIFIAVSVTFGVDALRHLKAGGFEDPGCESAQATVALHAHLGQDDGTIVVLYSSPRGLSALDPEFRAAMQESLANIKGRPDVGAIMTWYTTGAAAFLSTDKQRTFALVGLRGDEARLMELIGILRPLLASSRLDVKLGGFPAVFAEMHEQVEKDLQRAEMLSFPIVALLLVVIFGSVVAAMLPLIVGATTIFGGLFLLRVAATQIDVSVFAANTVSMLGLGLAIDYSLFIVSRFREELALGKEVETALLRTLETAGRTVLFSGITVAIALLSLEVFPIMFLASVARGGAAAVAIAVTTSLTLLPALLALLGHRVNAWPIRLRRARPAAAAASAAASSSAPGARKGFWYGMSLFVMRHAAPVFVVTFVVLAVLGLPFRRARFAIPDARVLPMSCESRAVSIALTTQFPRNETEPIQIVARTEGPVLDAAGISALYEYTRSVAALPGVRRIDGLFSVNPRLGKAEYVRFYAARSRATNLPAAYAATHYAKGRHALMSVLYDCDANSEEAQALIRAIRAVPAPRGLDALVGGMPAQLTDFLQTLARGVPRAVAIIVAVIFLLLYLMLGSLVIPLKAVILNVLSLSVSFGALVWVFQDGHCSELLGFTPLGAIDGAMPVLVFAVAFGLSMDYEVFLLSRIKEHYDRTGNAEESVALGVEKTGGIITSAALLLVVVIGSFATGQLIGVKQVGLGLGLAVLVDATVVRMLLVPAAMRLMGKYNWWAPRPLALLHQRLGLSEGGAE